MSKEISCFDIACNKAFVSIDGLREHGNIAHVWAKVFKCRFENCGRTFDQRNSFFKHLRGKHDCPLRFDHTLDIKRTQGNQGNSTADFHGTETNDNSMEAPMDQDESKIDQDETKINFFTALKHHADVLVAKPGLARNIVDGVIADVTHFLSSGPLEILKTDVLSTLSEEGAEPCKIFDIAHKFDSLTAPFDHLKSEYLREKYFESSGWYIPPIEYTIEIRPERRVNRDGSIGIESKPVTGQFFPLRKILKKYFELPDALSASVDYMEKLEQSNSNEISNLTQCCKWKSVRQKLYRPDDIVLPMTVYGDEYEPNKDLGPHCEKIGCIYIDLPCLPPECQSKLDNIIEALIYHAEDRKSYGNAKVFRPLIGELKFLETEGIIVETPTGPKMIFFAAVALKGDNLGLAGMCGFVECFVARYPCRVCKATMSDTEEMLVEDPLLLRTEDTYRADVLIERPDLTGIKEDFVFKDVQSLYCDGIISAFMLDPMHDGTEGVAHYTMIPVAKHLHRKYPRFIPTLNQRMYMFNHGKVDGRNEPVSISAERLEANKLKMTANEMITFVRFFGLYVGHLVDEEDEYWELYLLLHDIMSILQAKSLPSDIAPVFLNLVEEHHKLYMKLTGQSLKPKHHYLLHYGSLFLNFGSFGNISCMRDEARHKLMKAYTNVCLSRKNVLLSLAKKRMLALSLRFIINQSMLPSLLVGPGDLVDLSLVNEFSSFKHNLPPSVQLKPDCYCPKWVDFKGTRFEVGMILVVGLDKSRCPVFGEIRFIITEEKDVIFICALILNLGLNAHVRGFEVETGVPSKLVCKRSGELFSSFPLSIHSMANGETYIVPKSYL